MVDPKLGELTMSRLKSREGGMEDRTRECRKILGRLVVRGYMPIEPRDSWFSPKHVLAWPYVNPQRGIALNCFKG